MLSIFNNYRQELELLESYIKQKDTNDQLNILEAGCGRAWPIKLDGIKYHLTGLDADKKALEIRKHQTKDLHEIIEGDLRSVQLQESQYDVIYNSFVLEHIDGAENVLQKFSTWMKSGGILILRFPDRNSAYGFITRMTPFWFHVFFKKYIMGNPNAGKPGYDPYPAYYDPIVSRNGIRSFCEKNNFSVKEEWGHPFPVRRDIMGKLLGGVVRIFHILSFGKLAFAHNNLTYILEKK